MASKRRLVDVDSLRGYMLKYIEMEIHEDTLEDDQRVPRRLCGLRDQPVIEDNLYDCIEDAIQSYFGGAR